MHKQKHNNSTMVSTKLLTTLSPSTILPKPGLRRSIPFGSSYANAYGYEKLSNEDESKSLIDSINSYDSCSSSSGGTLRDGPADDDSTVVCSVSSILFSVGDRSISSDECSYSYSICSKSFLARGPSSCAPFKQYGEDGDTIDTSDYSNCTFDLSFMSRHAGLDYNGRTPPKDTKATSVKATTVSSDDMPREPLHHNDEDILEGARIVKEHFRAITCHQLEKTFDSDIDEDLSTSAKLLPGRIRSVEDEHKRHRVRKWLRRRNPVSALMRSLASPAA